MTKRDFEKSPRGGRGWLWLLVLPAVGFAGFVALIVSLFSALAEVEKSPGYELAARSLTSHAGVAELLGAPVRVTGTKAKHRTRTLNSTRLRLTLTLEGSSGQGSANVVASERQGHWIVERATVACSRGQFGLLADGGLQPLYDPKGVLATAP